MPTLHPNGVNHLALSTRDMKGQLEFWCDILGCPLKALYWMHGVEGTFHGFVELDKDSYVAFVQHPDNAKDIEYGVTHAGNPGAPVTAGAMQHVAFNVDTIEELYEMRDRIRSRGIQVLGPMDHGFIQSIYFAGPEGLSLEVATGSAIDERAWIDPEVRDLCGISEAEVAAMTAPDDFECPAEPLSQPPFNPDLPHMHYAPGLVEKIMGRSDEKVWEEASETTPPVDVS